MPTKDASPKRRHLDWESFEQRTLSGPPSVEVINGIPRVSIFVEPNGRRIGIHIFGSDGNGSTSPLSEVLIREMVIGKERALEVSTSNRDLYREFYSICCMIADHVQLDQREPIDAVNSTLAHLLRLLRRPTFLSLESQAGLFGELMFLRMAAAEIGWATAARSWFGPFGEEHDYSLPNVDVEVKTTLRENRVHKISSITQLMPKQRRRLYLLSIQITLSSGKAALSLPQLIAMVLKDARKNSAATADRISEMLERYGWNDFHACEYVERYEKRSKVKAIEISAGFPALTTENIRVLSKDAPSRISNVSYSLQVDGLGVSETSSSFRKALFGKGISHGQ